MTISDKPANSPPMHPSLSRMCAVRKSTNAHWLKPIQYGRSASLSNARKEADKIGEAGKLAADASEPIADVRGSEEYKRSLVKTYTVRALRIAVERAKGS